MFKKKKKTIKFTDEEFILAWRADMLDEAIGLDKKRRIDYVR